MAIIVMAYIVIAYIVMAYVFMAYIVMTYLVMTIENRARCTPCCTARQQRRTAPHNAINI